MFMFTTFIVIDARARSDRGDEEKAIASRTAINGRCSASRLMLVLINLLGVLALVVGLLVSIPVSVARLVVHAYRVLGGAQARAQP